MSRTLNVFAGALSVALGVVGAVSARPPSILSKAEKATIRSLADGNTYNFHWAAVYVRLGEGWQIAASQLTRVAEAR